ncbi:MAG: trans-sulfuration enzyme family protein [Shimia sp.]
MKRLGPPQMGTRPVATPIQPSVVYAADGPDHLDDLYEGRAEGFTYSREGHPNATTVAAMIDAMEGATGGVMTSSGMSAVGMAVLAVARAGDHVLGGDQLYGRSLRMLGVELPRLGIETSQFDPTDIASAEAALRPETRAILVEVVSNPTLRVADMEGLTALCRDRGIALIVDNTFTTPRAYRPFDHGADLVVHSVTKLLAGHSDAMLGYVAARDPEVGARLVDAATTWGVTASPFDCWLAERGMLSFDLRFARTTETARRLAAALDAHPAVTRCVYPGLSSHPDHDRAQALLGAATGNMVSFEIAGGRRESAALVAAMGDVAFAPTLGDINTTLSHAATSSHRKMTHDQRVALGMGEGFFRVSVGVEEADGLIATFAAALDQVRGGG